MYAGTTFRNGSGRIVGVHQKIDRVARRHLKKYLNHDSYFPPIKEILHFEGLNGPDGIKRKSPSRDEPWHFINPSNPADRNLVMIINDNIYNLSVALKEGNDVRAAFEAAWLSHAIVDGLTPAHHYPFSDKIEELWGKPQHERLTVMDKNFIKGNTYRDTISKNWQYWGVGGVFTAHYTFEWGVASAIASESFSEAAPTKAEIKRVVKNGFEAEFMRSLRLVDDMKMYDQFGATGWTHDLAADTRDKLLPQIIKTVCLAWYYAAYMARSENS